MGTTKQRRVFTYAVLAVLSAAVLAVAFRAYLHVPREHRIRDGVAAVEHGMTEQQVNVIMGGPADVGTENGTGPRTGRVQLV